MKTNPGAKILEEYRQKREIAKKQSEEKIRALKNIHPEYATVDDAIYGLNLDIAKATLTGENSALPKLQQTLAAMLAEKKTLLEKLNIHPQDLEPIYECSLCQDTGYRQQGDSWVKCSCFQNRLIKELYRDSGIMERMKQENFEYFQEQLFSDSPHEKYVVSPRENILDLKREAIAFINDFENSKRKNLIFYGDPGLGKTFLCTCIAKELLDRQKTVFYQSASDLFALLSDYTFSKEEKQREILRPVYDFVNSSDLLIIDDLGSELTNSFTLTVLFNILNHRMMGSKKILLSTNLNPGELHERYGERIASRLVMSFNYYRFYGKDLRWQL